MSLTGNFEQLNLDDGVLSVSGSSTGVDEGELVSRYVAVHQEGHAPAKGPAQGGGKWVADPPLAAPELTGGAALAVGVETYFKENIESLPTFVTFTWSQVVTITEA